MSTAVIPPLPIECFPYDPRSPAEARHWARDVLKTDGLASDEEIYDITVCVSELVTNSIEHTNPVRDCARISLKIRLDPLPSKTRIYVEVTDAGSADRTPIKRQATATDLDGRGLKIVSEYADAWGYEDLADGRRTTWFVKFTERTRLAGRP